MRTVRFVRNKCHQGRDYGPDAAEDVAHLDEWDARYYVKRGAAVYVEHRDPVVEHGDPVSPLDGLSRPKLLEMAWRRGLEVKGSGKNGYITAGDLRAALEEANG